MPEIRLAANHIDFTGLISGLGRLQIVHADAQAYMKIEVPQPVTFRPPSQPSLLPCRMVNFDIIFDYL
jgi:hypothetical protein